MRRRSDVIGCLRSKLPRPNVSPKATGKPRCAFVETALAFDEIPQRFIHVLGSGAVPLDAITSEACDFVELVGVFREDFIHKDYVLTRR
jgi:hypothetical protein